MLDCQPRGYDFDYGYSTFKALSNLSNLCHLRPEVKATLSRAVTTGIDSDGFEILTDCSAFYPTSFPVKDCLLNKGGETKKLYEKYFGNGTKIDLAAFREIPGHNLTALEVRFALWRFFDMSPLWSGTGQTFNPTSYRLAYREYLTRNRPMKDIGKRGQKWDIIEIKVCKGKKNVEKKGSEKKGGKKKKGGRMEKKGGSMEKKGGRKKKMGGTKKKMGGRKKMGGKKKKGGRKKKVGQ